MAENEPNFFQRTWGLVRGLWFRSDPITGTGEMVSQRATVTARAGVRAEPITGRAADTASAPSDTARGASRWRDNQRHSQSSALEPVYTRTEPDGLGLEEGGRILLEDGEPANNAQQIDQGIRNAFRGERTAILQWTDAASDTTRALQAALEQSGINDTEEIRGLLADQTEALGNIRRLVEDGATDEAVAVYKDALDRVVQSILKQLANPGVIRGLLIVAALSLLGPAVAASASGTVVAAAISGLDAKVLKAIFGASADKSD